MPTDPVGPRERRTDSSDPRPDLRPDPAPLSAPWWRRLGDAKLTPAIALLFFLGLMVLSGLAAGVGYVAHHFRAAVSQPR